MTRIQAYEGAGALHRARPRRALNGAGGFNLEEMPAESAGEAQAGAAAGGVASVPLLSLQEERDHGRRPRRDPAAQAEAMLEELGALQMMMLTGRADPARLQQLLVELDAHPESTETLVNSVQSAVRIRVMVELARLGISAQAPSKMLTDH
jgi:hypothetical protein